MDSEKLVEILFTGLVSGISGGMIALFGAYWKGKAELLGQIETQFKESPTLMALKRATAYEEEVGKRAATHADIENVVSELRLVTKEAELIRSQIGMDAWTRERVWEEKRVAYDRILKSCRELGKTLSNYVELRHANFMIARERHYSTEMAISKRSVEFDVGREFLGQIDEVSEEFDRAFVFLNADVVRIFDEYVHERTTLLSLVSTNHYDDGEETTQEKIVDELNFLGGWRGRLMAFAKLDLGVSKT